MVRGTFIFILVIAHSSPLVAQRIERSHIAVDTTHDVREAQTRVSAAPRPVVASSRRRPDTGGHGAMIVNGLVFGAAGMFGGGYLGYHLESASGCGAEYFCGLAGALLGGLVGETLGVSTGIHLAGGRSHSFAGDLGLAFGIAALGVVTAPVTFGISLLAVPVAQLFVGTYREGKALAGERPCCTAAPAPP